MANEKDVAAIRIVVIRGIRERFSYDEVSLKIVDPTIRGAKASVAIVYSGKAPRAEVAAVAAASLISHMRDWFRLRKFSYIVLNVSKVSSRRGLKFVVTTRAPRRVYTLLPKLVKVLRDLGLVVRRWSLRKVKPGPEGLKLSIIASAGIPELDLGNIFRRVREVLAEHMKDMPLCVDLEIRKKLGSVSKTLCYKPSSSSTS